MRIKTFIYASFLVIISTLSYGQKNANLTNGIAIAGYDVISYYNGKPIKGNSNIKANYLDGTYYFNSLSNKQRFIANPSKYVPEYGGWCAYAMGNDGTKVEVDPETYKILNGKLFLFYNAYFTNTKTKWDKDEAKLKISADKYWSKINSK